MVEIKGIQKVVKLYDRINKEVVQQAVPLKQIGVLLLNEIDTYFQISGNPYDGGQWRKNAPSTIARKGSSKPLIDTGNLRASFTFDYKPKELKVGTPVSYAEFHQEGNRVPRRPMLPAERRVAQISEEQYEKYIAKLISTS